MYTLMAAADCTPDAKMVTLAWTFFTTVDANGNIASKPNCG
jgi:hypothetical protein